MEKREIKVVFRVSLSIQGADIESEEIIEIPIGCSEEEKIKIIEECFAEWLAGEIDQSYEILTS